MNDSAEPSIQDALHRLDHQSFFGREGQLDLLREQLILPWDASRRRYVLNVFGQGGVGKTTLLHEFRRLAREAGALSAFTDHNENSAPAAMGRLAAQLIEVGGPDATLAFSKFTERHAAYQKKRGELEADPDAPQGFAGLFAGAATRLGAKFLRNTVPGSDLVLDLVEQPLAEQAGLWAEFARRKLGNRDEVQLVLEPETVLTPLFLRALGELCAARRVVLLFDTYEVTAGALDGWLRAVLEGRHGRASSKLTLVVAGRHELARNAWGNLIGLVASLPLDPFTEAEARDYLARENVTNEQVINVILTLSGRLPLLLATLAAASPDDPARVGDATGTAVERFLSWVDDPARRALALNGALPRRLNRDVVGLLGGDATGFDWLIGQPFVQRQPAGDWAYHDVAREQMLGYKRAESPAGWKALHEKLAEHYRAAGDALGLTPKAGPGDPAWQAAALEEIYHLLCARPQRELGPALNAFAAMLDTQLAAAGDWAATMAAAGRNANNEPLKEWGESLGGGLKAYKEGQYEKAIEAYGKLADSPLLEATNQAIVLNRRGLWRRQIEHYDAALADFDRALELNPQYIIALRNRAVTNDRREMLEEALDDYSRMIELDRNNTWTINNRGMLNERLGRYEEALADYSRVIDLDPSNPSLYLNRARFYQERERYGEALEDYNRAIGLNSTDPWSLLRRARFYQRRERYEEALADYSRAIELNPSDLWPRLNRARFYQERERYEEALADYSRAIELDPRLSWSFLNRAKMYQQRGQYEEALADYSRAIELDPRQPWNILNRAWFYQERKRHEEALADFNRAVELEEGDAWAIASRGVILGQMNRHEQALADFDRAIELDGDYAWAIASRGVTLRQMGHYEAALTDLDKAIELDGSLTWAVANRGETRRRLEQYEAALADFEQVIEPNEDDAWVMGRRGETRNALRQFAAALTDFDRAVALEPENDWWRYQRGITRWRLNEVDDWRDDLDAAISRATAGYQANSADGRYLFNLAVYHVARGDDAEAEARYREGLATQPPAALRREAIADLEQFLALFPNDTLAAQMRSLLAGTAESSGPSE